MHESIGPRLPWIACKAANLAMHTLPVKDGMTTLCYPGLGEDECYDRAMEICPEVIEEMKMVLKKIARVCEENGITDMGYI